MMWPFRRLQPGWWHTPAGWVLGLALVLPSSLLAIPLTQYAPAWALPAAVAGLVIALASTIGFFVVKRHSWLLAAPLSIGISFSFCLSLVEGWETQVKTAIGIVEALLVIASVGLFVAMFVFLGRMSRRLNRASRDMTHALGEQIADEGLFRDDGERIIVHVRRARVLARVLVSLAVLALIAACVPLVRANVSNLFWQIAAFACIGLLLFLGSITTLLTFMRALMTSPTLVVNADGIVDNGSMIVTGRGLLRWNEVLGVEESVIASNRIIAYRYLDLDVADWRAISRRQPAWKRVLARLTSQRQPMGFRIPRTLLDRPPATLATEINRYIHTHAPEGSWHKTATDEKFEQPSDGQPGWSGTE